MDNKTLNKTNSLKETCYVNAGFNITPDTSPTTTQSPSSLSSSPSMTSETPTHLKQRHQTHNNNNNNATQLVEEEITATAARLNSKTNNYVNQSLLVKTTTTSVVANGQKANGKYASSSKPCGVSQQTAAKTSKFHSIKMLPQYLLNNSKIKQLINHNNNHNHNNANSIHLSTPDLYKGSVAGKSVYYSI